jgi:RNA polymerase sigma factor (sigma-70 family)
MPRKIDDRPLTDAERDMAEEHQPLVKSVAVAMGVRITDDVLQEGCTGLMKATQRFDPGRGFAFSTYATYWIKQAIWRHVTRDRLVKIPDRLLGKDAARYSFADAAAKATRIDSMARRGDRMKWNEVAVVEDHAGRIDAAAELRQLELALAALPYTERAVIRRRMGGSRIRDIGRGIGITRKAVKFAENRAMAKLKRALAPYAD